MIRNIILIFAGSVVCVAIGRAAWQHHTARLIKITSADEIDSLEKIRLGGIDQWILIRAWQRDNPVLLLLHGGPGFPGMPFAPVTAELEKHFVVVRWDQRGAGKSFSRSIPPSAMNIEHFVADTLELTDLLRRRFARPRIILAAHSWGSIIGALAVAKSPDRFSEYIGVCQVADPLESERLMYRWGLTKAAEAANQKARSELQRIGPPPYQSFKDYHTMTSWIAHFSEAEHQPVTRTRFVRLAFSSPFYSWADLARIACGAKFSFEALWREAFYKVNLLKQVPQFDVPVFFFLGRHDHTPTASAAMAERYYDTLIAARGKQLIWFEHSGHWPHLEETGRFESELVRVSRKAIASESAVQ